MSPAIERMQAGKRKAEELRRREAVKVVALSRSYDRDAAQAFAVGKAEGFGSEAHMEAKRKLRMKWPVLPPMATAAQMRLVYGDHDAT